MAGAVIIDPSTETESVYVVGGNVSPELITTSLQALLPTRHHPMARHRFTMLDTFDGRIRRAGARLTRSGVNGSATIAWQSRGGFNQLTVRVKEPVSFAWDLPPCSLQQALSPVIGARRLFAKAEVERSGSLLEVLDERAKTVARLRIETSRVRLPASRAPWQALPTLITLTGLRGYGDAYKRLANVIESRPGAELRPEGVDGVTLRQVGELEPADVASLRLELESTVRADIGARQIHRALLRVLVTNEPGVRASLDIEFLHDFRVALRRTRSLLGQIKHVFPPDIVGHFSTEFSWIGRLTGPARDVDVLSLSLRDPEADLSDSDREMLQAFFTRAQQQEHQKVVESLNSDRYRRLIEEWQAFLEQPPRVEPEPRNAGGSLADVVRRRAWRLSRRIAASAAIIDDHTEAARLHEVRIAAKKLRYLVDATPNFYDATDLEPILNALKRLQRVLGEFNDANVQERRLLECAGAMPADVESADARLALEKLAEQSRHRRERLRKKVVDGLSRFCARDTQAAFRRAFKDAPVVETTP